MLPGPSGFRWMPRKMAGIAMITIEASIVAIVMLERGIGQGHPLVPVAVVPESAATRLPQLSDRLHSIESTAIKLLDGNYLTARRTRYVHHQVRGSLSRRAATSLSAVNPAHPRWRRRRGSWRRW